jgi:GntR family transcriptional regulator
VDDVRSFDPDRWRAFDLITRVNYDQHGTPCEFSRDLFRGDRTRLAVTVQGRGIGVQPAVDTASVALQS